MPPRTTATCYVCVRTWIPWGKDDEGVMRVRTTKDDEGMMCVHETKDDRYFCHQQKLTRSNARPQQ